MLEKLINRIYQPGPSFLPDLRYCYGPRNGAVTGAIVGIVATLATAYAARYAPELITNKPVPEPLDLAVVAYAGAIMIPLTTAVMAGTGYLQQRVFCPAINKIFGKRT